MTGRPPPTEGAAELYGAAGERTSLAWQRTALGVVLGSFVLFVVSARLGVIALGTVAVGVGLTLAVVSVMAFPTGGNPAAAQTRNSWAQLMILSAAVAALGLLGALAALITLLAP
jgi:uncharacterized membrane protein YidH (DUF202 family)